MTASLRDMDVLKLSLTGSASKSNEAGGANSPAKQDHPPTDPVKGKLALAGLANLTIIVIY
jgi:hypothetical protein